jgi:quercetin dioxygenase-like cupin family protein
MTRIAALLALGLTLVGSSYAMQDAPHFTGKSIGMDARDLSAARRSFEAGARSAWHSHDNGQLLMVEDGRMRTQKKGGPIQELGKGESD